jgi:hypothetical protein
MGTGPVDSALIFSSERCVGFARADWHYNDCEARLFRAMRRVLNLGRRRALGRMWAKVAESKRCLGAIWTAQATHGRLKAHGPKRSA